MSFQEGNKRVMPSFKGFHHTELAKSEIGARAEERWKRPGFREHMSEAHKDKHPSDATRELMSIAHQGQIPYNKGKKDLFHHTEATKEFLRIANSGSNNFHFGKPCPEYLKQRQKELMLGPNNFMRGKKGALCPNYVDGRFIEEKQARATVRELDNDTCVLTDTPYCCPKTKKGKEIVTHHRDYNEENNDIDNIVCLCKSCHSKTSGKTKSNRDFWQALFESMMLIIRARREENKKQYEIPLGGVEEIVLRVMKQ